MTEWNMFLWRSRCHLLPWVAAALPLSAAKVVRHTNQIAVEAAAWNRYDYRHLLQQRVMLMQARKIELRYLWLNEDQHCACLRCTASTVLCSVEERCWMSCDTSAIRFFQFVCICKYSMTSDCFVCCIAYQVYIIYFLIFNLKDMPTVHRGWCSASRVHILMY